MRVLVVGGSGQLGSCLLPCLHDRGHDVVSRSRSTVPPLDATLVPGVVRALQQIAPQAIVYAAALTDLVACEHDATTARALHRDGAAAAAQWAAEHGSACVYVSTDSVFDGRRGWYTEDDEPAPLNVYAESKLLGEREVTAAGGTVVRTNFLGAGARSLAGWLRGELLAGREVTGYADVVFNPLHAADVAEVIARLLSSPRPGVLHVAGREAVSKLQVAEAAARILRSGTVTAGTMPQDPLRRPRNTTLDASMADRLVGIPDRGWERTLRDILTGSWD